MWDKNREAGLSLFGLRRAFDRGGGSELKLTRFVLRPRVPPLPEFPFPSAIPAGFGFSARYAVYSIPQNLLSVVDLLRRARLRELAVWSFVK